MKSSKTKEANVNLILKQLNNYRKNFGIIVFAALAAAALDWYVNVRANLVLVSGILLIHIFPTLFIPHHLFDRRREWLAALVYIYAGPVGLGVMVHAFTQNIWLDHSVPEGVTPSVGILIVLTVAVLLSYWDSGTMSREARKKERAAIQHLIPTSLKRYLWVLDNCQQHIAAEKLEGLIGLGMYEEALGWFEETIDLLPPNYTEQFIVDEARASLSWLLDNRPSDS